MKLSIDSWIENRNYSNDKDIKESYEAVTALQTLNGKNVTQLIVGDINGFILIGGGPELFVVTQVVGEDEAFFNLINPECVSDEEEISLVTGGQAGGFPKKNCVPLALAEQALTYYVKHGDRSPSLRWEEE
ncbi:Imm1 family immunity protein [Chitinophaga pinensis]|uniref:Immunity protein Imm1 n=1 Tax=Chitinophaga pinensis (strain ATCC 43595 / DSM 2588 / LMG 13176 / NBRC 15968 / NCIMB 11800 / UQM 2034) TaxID=485918 RepID=A0A979G397_CHIPD|nr:Imm1 family immunity protein [Chitinophaga pinensis]ACU60029.1 conserved hypothetical protein [Chitinophaga pinensis DSM 2588]